MMWERAREQSQGLPCATSRARLREQTQKGFGFRRLDTRNLAVCKFFMTPPAFIYLYSASSSTLAYDEAYFAYL